MTPPRAPCPPQEATLAGWRRCLLCFPLRCQRPPPSQPCACPLAAPLCVSSPPALLRVPALGSLVRSPWRQEEGRGPAAPSSVRRTGAQPSRGGRTAAGHVGRTAPPGRLRSALAAAGPGPRLHREEATRALRDREVSALRPSSTPPREHSRRGAGRRGAASGAAGSRGSALSSWVLSVRAQPMGAGQRDSRLYLWVVACSAPMSGADLAETWGGEDGDPGAG